ncbi:MAG: ethanolamine ammonia-lyase subunit EutC [Actinomycetales bacterium]
MRPPALDPDGVHPPDEAQGADFWAPLRATTQARIGLGRTGDALPTARVLEFREAHALARDAVHAPLDSAAVLAGLGGLGLGEPIEMTSRAQGREEYVRRPDLGRLPADLGALHGGEWDVGLVLMDGLSSTAVHAHGVELATAIVAAIGDTWSIAPPVLATQARVALGDHLGAALGVRTLLVIIGERPGLSVADSLGIYLTHNPRPGLPDSARNCISNIHPPDGLGYHAAARTAISLIAGAREIGESGVRLKDTGGVVTQRPDAEPPEHLAPQGS